MRAVIAILAVVAALAAGCQHAEDRYLARTVAAEELTGVWQLTPDAVKNLSDAGYTAPIDASEHRITLRADGTCDFQTLPQIAVTPRGPAARIDAPCTWKLGTVGHQALMIDVAGDPPQHPYYYFTEQPGGHLAIWQHIDDPDAWRYVEYVKQ